MTTQIIRTGTDTWAGSDHPSRKHGADTRLTVQADSAYGYIFHPLGHELRGTTIIQATLYIYGQNSGWGEQTITVRRVTERWPEPLTWNDKPAVGATSATLTQNNPNDPSEWAIDVTNLVQQFAAGERWFGVRIALTAAVARQFNSFQAAANKPRLEVRYTEAPAAPSDLNPDGGFVSVAKPTLQWTHQDDSGDTTLAAVQVQVHTSDVWTDPMFDSGTVLSNVPQLDLSSYSGSRTASVTITNRTITNKALTSNVATLTTSVAHGFIVGQQVNVAGVDTTFNGNYTITATGTSTTFSYAKTATNVTSVASGGTARSTTITAAAGTFAQADVGAGITGTGIPANTTIASVQSDTSARLSAAPTAGATITATITRSAVSVAEGQKVYWRAREQDGAGLWSKWSDTASFSRTAKGTVSITTPGDLVAEWTPPIAWTTTGLTQEAWRVLVQKTDDARTEVYDSGRQAGTATTHTLPPKVLRTDKRDYRLVVRVWDTIDRVHTPGDPAYIEDVQVFRYEDDPTPDRVTNLAAVQVGFTPYTDLTWTRATTPDFWTILRSGEVVETEIPGADLLLEGTTYGYRDRDARPFIEQGWQVKPTVNGLTVNSPMVALTPKPAGIWVLGPDDVDVVLMGNNALGEFSMVDRGTTFAMPSGESVRVVQGVGGLEGTISGRLLDVAGRSVEKWRERLLAIKTMQDPVVTIFVGTEAIRARIFNINVDPSRDGGQTRNASFEFIQTGNPEWLVNDKDHEDSDPDEDPDNGGNDNPDPDPHTNNTQPFRLVTCNLQANPPMDQDKVENDINRVKAMGSVILWQEMKLDRYNAALHRLMDDSNWIHIYSPEKAVPISIKRNLFTVIDRKAYKMHDGKANTSPSRWIVVALVRMTGTNIVFLVVNTHMVSGAWNNKQRANKAWRKDKWNLHRDKLDHLVNDARGKGISVIGGGDWNKTGVNMFHANMVNDSTGNIIYLFHLPATGGTTFVRNKMQSINVASDHNVRLVELKPTAGANAIPTQYNWPGLP